MGNTAEGSLVGIARNDPLRSNVGFVNVLGNVGFGTHKSFCHVRGPEPIRNMSVQNNVSVQQTDDRRTGRTAQFAGVSVDVDAAQNLSIRNNELHGYDGHGIRVATPVTGLAVQQNRISDAGLDGIRLSNGGDGLVTGNVITNPAEAGVRLRGTAFDVRQNYVHGAGTSGIVAEQSSSGGGNTVAANVVAANGRQSGRSPPAIHVHDAGVRVRGNTVRETETVAIAESDTAESNLYENNWADGDQPWQITSSTATVNDNTPPIDVHRGVSTDAGSTVVSVEFDRPYADPPRLSFGRAGGGIRERSYETDANGNYVGVTLRTRDEGGTLDVFVDD